MPPGDLSIARGLTEDVTVGLLDRRSVFVGLPEAAPAVIIVAKRDLRLGECRYGNPLRHTSCRVAAERRAGPYVP